MKLEVTEKVRACAEIDDGIYAIEVLIPNLPEKQEKRLKALKGECTLKIFNKEKGQKELGVA